MEERKFRSQTEKALFEFQEIEKAFFDRITKEALFGKSK